MAITTFTGDLSAEFPAGTSLEARPASNWPAIQRPPAAGTTPVGAATATAVSNSSGVVSFTGLADSTEYYVSDAAGTRYVRVTTFPVRQELMTSDIGVDVPALVNLPVNVKDKGARGDGNAEPATPFQNAYNTALVQGRDVYIPAGTYYVSDAASLCVISVGRDNAGTAPKVRVVMDPGVTIKLSAATPRLVDFKRTADDDLIHDFEIDGRGATIDCNNVGGNHHIIAGTFGSGLTTSHLNFKRITIRNLRGINAPTDAAGTNFRAWIDIHPSHSAAGQTQTVIEDILVEWLHLDGGTQGVGIMGGGANVLGQDIRCDRITIRDCYHDTGLTPTFGGAANANFHIASRGWGGRATIARCVAKRSNDICFETDGFNHALIEDCDAYESVNPFYATNYNNLQQMSEQEVTFRNCRVHRDSLNLTPAATPGQMFGFRVESMVVGGTTVAAPRVLFDRCTYHRTTTEAVGDGEAFYVKGTIRDVKLDKCQVVIDGLSLTGNAGGAGMAILIQNDGATVQTVDIDKSELSIGGAYVSGTPAINAIRLNGVLRLAIDGLRCKFNITSWAAQAIRLIDIANVASTINGHIRGVEVLDATGMDHLQQIVLGSDANLTIPDRLLITECKFQNQTNDVRFLGTTNFAKVVLRDNQWGTFTGTTAKDLTIASAAALTVPSAAHVQVTGTTNVTSMTAGPPESEVTLRFSGILTFTDGSNLQLAGNFVTTADDTITLVCDGTNWSEKSRSVN